MRSALVLVIAAACSFRGPDLTGDALGPLRDGPPGCIGSACRHLALTVHHEQVAGGPHARFPLLIVLDEPDLATSAADSGFDLIFVDADLAPLPYERERFASGALVAWVGLPVLRGDVDTTLYLYYGDRGATVDHQDAASVWDAGYQGVWHLAQAVGGANALLDSTAHASHATDEGGPVLGAPGAIGRGVAFDGVDDRLHVTRHAALDTATATGTLSMWVEWIASGSGTNQRLLMSSNTFTGDLSGMEWATNGVGDYYYYPANAGAASDYDGVARPFTDGTWHHLVLTQDFPSKTVVFYLDGTPLTIGHQGIPATWTKPAGPGDWFWGGVPPRARFGGTLDEIRVSSVLRTPGWIATEYANQHAPTAFVTATP